MEDGTDVTLSQLMRELIEDSYSLEELKDLCWNLELNYDELPGDRLSRKVTALLAAIYQAKVFRPFHTFLTKDRENVEWPPLKEIEAYDWSKVVTEFEFKPSVQYWIESIGGSNNKIVQGDHNIFAEEGSVVVQGDNSGPIHTGDIVYDQRTIYEGLQDIEQLKPEKGAPPYKGLQKFEEEDHEWFFGREQVTADLITKLHDTNFLIVIGASGSGKSSVVRAGILPVMRGIIETVNGTVPPMGDWQIFDLTPTSIPLGKLAATLYPDKDQKGKRSILFDQLKEHQSSTLVNQVAKLINIEEGEKLLLLVDQFEEIFTQCKIEADRKTFINNLIEAAQNKAVKVILTMRADFYGYCLEHDNLRKLIDEASFSIGPMSHQELVDAILKPADAGNWTFQKGLWEEMLEDVANQKGGLPLLSHALHETWKNRRGRTLTLSGYREAGKVEGAIAKTAQQTYEKLDEAEQKIAEKIFLSLTELGEGFEDTRRISSQIKLTDQIGGDSEKIEQVVQKLANARLITTDKNKEVEVAHEALIRNWPLLKNWLDDNRERLRFERKLEEDAKEWSKNKRDESYLYTGARLQQAIEWHGEQILKNDKFIHKFVNSGQEKAEYEIRVKIERQRRLFNEQRERANIEEQARMQAEADAQRVSNRNRIAFSLAGLAGVLMIVALILFSNARESAAEAEGNAATAIAEQVRADQKAQEARDAQKAAETSEAEALENANIAAAQKVIADEKAAEAEMEAQAAIEARSTAQASEAEAGKQTQLAQTQALLSLSTSLLPQNRYPRISESELSRLMAIQAVDLNERLDIKMDVNFVSTQSQQTFEKVWRSSVDTPLQGHKNGVTSVALSPNGQILASAGKDHTIRLWNLSSEDPSVNPRILIGHEDEVWSIAFSPNGERLASAGKDDSIRIWDLTASDPSANPNILLGHDNWIRSVAFSPDGQMIASASYDDTVRLWDLTVSDPSIEPRILQGHTNWVWSVAFSPDGETIASAGADSTIRLWDITVPDPQTNPRILQGFESRVEFVFFSPDGKTLASATEDHIIRLWDMTAPEPSANPQALRGHVDAVNSVAFSSNGKVLASASDDRTIRLWNLTSLEIPSTTRILQGHENNVSSVAFSSDGQTLVSASDDASVRLWALTTPDPTPKPQIFQGHKNVVWSVAFSPNGKTLASASFDDTVLLWDLTVADPSASPIILKGHESGVWSIAFSPDGKTLASSSDDNTIRLWDLTVPNPSANPVILKGHESGVWSIAFSPDGKTLASGSDDGIIQLWDLSSKDLDPSFRTFQGHNNSIRSIAFSPDGQTLASASGNILFPTEDDHIIRLWDLTITNSSAPSLTLRGHQSFVWSVAFSPDGETLASASDDETIWLWNLMTSDPSIDPQVLQGHESSVTSVSFSPNGETLASSGADKTIRLWDLTSSTPSNAPIVVQGHESVIWSVTFSPNGRMLASASNDQTVRNWLTLESLIDLSCQQANRNFTWEEWNQFLSAFPYQKTCNHLPVHCSVPLTEWPDDYPEYEAEQDACHS